ncbi:hypothetical protein DESC_600037 [Desulfosarcina cetonica]|nr:hypothetical protein DESC_600037 [Desulfosarcina cetonica]
MMIGAVFWAGMEDRLIFIASFKRSENHQYGLTEPPANGSATGSGAPLWARPVPVR